MTFPALGNVSCFSSVLYTNQLYINYFLKASVGAKVLRKRLPSKKSRNTLATGRLAVHVLTYFNKKKRLFCIVSLFEKKVS
jgi:hypothetical protein